ncbi:hypothetical protein GJ744_010639 [Endocarpon pusillum]|uniref:Uncharacterized protein n=1 Tax=Endocarpon pusillum TaxID=364733 RepID=A0A8H7AQ80_9EURO|nr:hypothetical protein GJ744_010639 [Endocarpon pusillum]
MAYHHCCFLISVSGEDTLRHNILGTLQFNEQIAAEIVSLYKASQQLRLTMERAVQATTASVRAATAYLFNAFQEVCTPMAIIGGLSVSLRGCTREIKGLEIAASGLREVAGLLRTWRSMQERR